MPIVYFCDGCNKRLEDADGQTNTETKKSYLESGGKPVAFEENFCSICLQHAHAYWNEKHDRVAEAIVHFKKTIDNHRNAFFGRRRSIKAVAK